MQENFYAHSLYRVQEDKATEFIAAWEEFNQALVDASVSQLSRATLIQSESDPLLFYSFGAWESLEPIKGLQQNEQVKQALLKMGSLSQRAEPGNYRIVRQITF